jgi:hypothetical protein
MLAPDPCVLTDETGNCFAQAVNIVVNLLKLFLMFGVAVGRINLVFEHQRQVLLDAPHLFSDETVVGPHFIRFQAGVVDLEEAL